MIDYRHARQSAEVLLVLQILVDGDEGVEVDRRQREQLAVLDATPTHFDRSPHRVKRKRVP